MRLRRSPRWLVSLLAALVVTGCSSATTSEAGSSSPPDLLPAPAVATPITPSKAAPTRIVIPAIGVDAGGFVPLGIQGRHGVPVVTKAGELATPDDHHPMTPGWWTGAAVPGDPGTAVIVAHVDGFGHRGLFYRLSQVKPGDVINVSRSDGKTAVFTVSAVARVPKDRFPTASFYSGQQGAELHLATCGGRYDPAHRRYLDQILVWSKLARLQPSAS